MLGFIGHCRLLSALASAEVLALYNEARET